MDAKSSPDVLCIVPTSQIFLFGCSLWCNNTTACFRAGGCILLSQFFPYIVKFSFDVPVPQHFLNAGCFTSIIFLYYS
uniref:Putative ovule protein n=1 Tax=Solanum chacoense TaxID=4108 RepID=A0A0V0H2E2_SOLCH